MNRCPNCAAQNREGAKFCTSCGFRLPTESAPLASSERSPFATTSTVPPYLDTPRAPAPTTEAEAGFGTWNLPPVEDEHAPGPSWDAAPPPDTGVPVNDDMIASLVSEPEPAAAETAEESNSWGVPSRDFRNGSTREVERSATGISPSFDHLLKLVRELEYELVELADSAPAPVTGDSRLLANALADLQDEDDLAPLRNAVATAQERPRDVDVMLDLVLRADAISTLLVERDQLKSAIMLFLADAAEPARTDDASHATSDSDETNNDDVELSNGSETTDSTPENDDLESDDSQVI